MVSRRRPPEEGGGTAVTIIGIMEWIDCVERLQQSTPAAARSIINQSTMNYLLIMLTDRLTAEAAHSWGSAGGVVSRVSGFALIN